MAGYGEELRLERERRGISLDALSAETKIQHRHLLSLENGRYQDLPGGVFRRGMTRAYLKALELDEPSWMERFDLSAAEHARMLGLGAGTEPNAWAEFATNVKRNRITGREPRDWRWFGVLILLAILVVSAWAVWRFEVVKLPR